MVVTTAAQFTRVAAPLGCACPDPAENPNDAPGASYGWRLGQGRRRWEANLVGKSELKSEAKSEQIGGVPGEAKNAKNPTNSSKGRSKGGSKGGSKGRPNADLAGLGVSPAPFPCAPPPLIRPIPPLPHPLSPCLLILPEALPTMRHSTHITVNTMADTLGYLRGCSPRLSHSAVHLGL